MKGTFRWFEVPPRLRSGFLLLLGVACGFIGAERALALPQFSVESASSCSSCHVAPENWTNPDLKWRKCSLNCNACHVNPTGGGLRHEAGRFYAMTALPQLSGPSLPPPDPSDPPPPSTAERFGGIAPNPRIQVGADIRAMAYFPEGGGDPDVFPMQTDLHFAVRPYNPPGQNTGRLTLFGTLGALGSRSDQTYDRFSDRIYLKEAVAMFHDLPYQAYAKLGRFLPPFGWRLDDHSVFIRQNQTFDHERQVTGLELGVNPNYAFLHGAVFANTPTGRFPQVDDSGYGVALHAGWRDLLWQAGGSVMFEDRDDANDTWAGLNWAVNAHRVSHPWKGWNLAPIVYLGEINWRHREPDFVDPPPSDQLAAYHELVIALTRGLRAQIRHDWIDPDTDFENDHANRYTGGLVLHPHRYVEFIAQVRRTATASGDDETDGLVQVHLWGTRGW